MKAVIPHHRPRYCRAAERKRCCPLHQFVAAAAAVLLVVTVSSVSGFSPENRIRTPLSALSMNKDEHNDNNKNLLDRRGLFGAAASAATSGLAILSQRPQPASAQVFFDPAMYGDQELRVSAVDSLKEAVRRAILKSPALAPSFYQLALLDALSFNAATNEYGPDGAALILVLTSKETDPYTQNLQEAALALVNASKTLKTKNGHYIGGCRGDRWCRGDRIDWWTNL